MAPRVSTTAIGLRPLAGSSRIRRTRRRTRSPSTFSSASGARFSNSSYGGVINSGPLKGIKFGPGGVPIAVRLRHAHHDTDAGRRRWLVPLQQSRTGNTDEAEGRLRARRLRLRRCAQSYMLMDHTLTLAQPRSATRVKTRPSRSTTTIPFCPRRLEQRWLAMGSRVSRWADSATTTAASISLSGDEDLAPPCRCERQDRQAAGATTRTTRTARREAASRRRACASRRTIISQWMRSPIPPLARRFVGTLPPARPAVCRSICSGTAAPLPKR